MIKVMVVDDDMDVRESLGEWLMREYEVCQAASVPDALALLPLEQPDIMVVDFELPPYRGDDFLALLAERASAHRTLHADRLAGTRARLLLTHCASRAQEGLRPAGY